MQTISDHRYTTQEEQVDFLQGECGDVDGVKELKNCVIYVPQERNDEVTQNKCAKFVAHLAKSHH